jgi:quercetin dioxygenase-like cupin family protein
MPPEVTPFQRPEWTPLPTAGCVRVEARALLRTERVSLAQLRFGPHGTIHEHPAPIEIDVVCLEGGGFTSVDGEAAPLAAGQKVRWPAGRPHRLWTEDSPMLTLMVEHANP